MMTRLGITAATLGLCTALPAFADDPAWPDLKHALYGDQLLTQAGNIIEINAPYRSTDDARTQIGGKVTVPDGQMIESVTVILDENPMPVSAVFDLANPVPHFSFDMSMRINGPTPMHIVTKTDRGQLFVSETFVKTSGTGACAAPPGTDPQLALATLGDMTLEVRDAEPSISLASLTSEPGAADKRLDIAIEHPSHSGLQMDQITLLFIHARFIDTIDVDVDGQDFVEITGSISLSENPDVDLSIPGTARQIDVTLTDTDGHVSTSATTVAGL